MNKNISHASSDIIDSKLEVQQLCGSKLCPCCGHELSKKPDWVGFPAGVKFDPSDQELMDHLEGKVDGKDAKSHPMIDEFIPTIEGEDGICYTHPEKLPGVSRDGLSRHFFHRPSKAYTTGTRKRRKIQTECDMQGGGGETRWHKTGKTRPVMSNGKQKGCKKILVLYTNFGKNRKPEKTNWVMHQYHLGHHEEEKEGELVVSKIFYQTQPRQCNWTDKNAPVTAIADAASCSNSKEVITNSDGFSPAAMPMPSFCPLEFQIHHLKSTFRKGADEVVEDFGETTRRAMHVQSPHQHQSIGCATTSFDCAPRSHALATAIVPHPLHHAATMLHHGDLYHSILQRQHHQQEHRKTAERSSGLEDLIMACTTNHIDIKEVEPSMVSQQETEWMKYSFWPDPGNQDNH